MAITILQRPEGHILDTTENTATVSESYGAGDAQFVAVTTHGLVDGDYIYTESDIEDYAGFWYVDVITTGIFKIKPYSGGDYVQFINAGSITWHKSTLTHGWSAVHLPITYRISNNIYPTNSSDTTRNINSLADISGWTVVNISGSLGTIHSFDFVKITVPNDPDLSGVYQIIEWISSTVMIINLAYDSSDNFTSATIQKYYNNYNVVVRIYAGINASHQWASQKSYELATTLKLIPDSDNEVFFSINEVLKSYIQTRNNLGLGTLPNNIDFWTNFYIETAEMYDDSDGYTFGSYTSSYTSDQSNFEGIAVNADLEFKNLYSGYLSEYLMTNSTAKFLTLFTIPALFACSEDAPDCYQDISFLNPYDDIEITIRNQYYLNGSSAATSETVVNADKGVIRAELSADCSYDRVDISLINSLSLPSFPTSWAQIAEGTRQWTIDSDPNITLLISTSSYILYTPLSAIQNKEYSFSYNITNTGLTTAPFIQIGFLDASFNFINDFETIQFSGSQTLSGNFTISPEDRGVYLGIYAVNDDAASAVMVINSLTLNTAEIPISETKTFDIKCGCSNKEIRLTWLNNLGGFDYWNFTGKKDHIIEIQEALVTKKNIFPQWPKSYGATADTIRKQTSRTSNKAYTVRAQHLTLEQADAIAYIKSSVLVQIINSRQDKRTVILDTDSFVKYKDQDKLYTIAFNVSFTDDIPAQTV